MDDFFKILTMTTLTVNFHLTQFQVGPAGVVGLGTGGRVDQGALVVHCDVTSLVSTVIQRQNVGGCKELIVLETNTTKSKSYQCVKVIKNVAYRKNWKHQVCYGLPVIGLYSKGRHW